MLSPPLSPQRDEHRVNMQIGRLFACGSAASAAVSALVSFPHKTYVDTSNPQVVYMTVTELALTLSPSEEE